MHRLNCACIASEWDQQCPRSKLGKMLTIQSKLTTDMLSFQPAVPKVRHSNQYQLSTKIVQQSNLQSFLKIESLRKYEFGSAINPSFQILECKKIKIQPGSTISTLPTIKPCIEIYKLLQI